MKSLHILRKSLLFGALMLCSCAWAGDITWIDVRTAEEFAQKHVPDAVNIPYDQIGSDIASLELDKDQTIYLYCGSGRRAGLAKETLDALGYTQVSNIGGLEDALAKAEKSAGE